MTKQVRVRQDTYLALEKLKRPGQSYDGAIKELLQRTKDSQELEVEA